MIRAAIFCGLIASAFAQDSVHTLAGRALTNGSADGPVANALFNDPSALAADVAGNLYLADSQNHVIRKIGANGQVSTFAGQAGNASYADGTSPRFDTPSGIAVSISGDILVCDTGNHVIRKITASGAATTIAGTAGQSGFTDATGAAARFNAPLGIAVSASKLIYVADTGNHTIRVISTNGVVTTLAGSPGNWGATDGIGSAARFNSPLGLALDSHGDLFVSDSNNHTIRKISPDGAVITWAGMALQDGFNDGPRLAARFSKPAEIAFDAHGNLFIADSFNHLIRKISPDDNVSTVTGLARNPGAADGNNGQARLNNPYGLAILPDGRLAITDAYNQTIRSALPPTPLQLTVTPNQAFLTWPSIIGQTYQLQYADPNFQSWQNLGNPVKATAISTTLADPALPRLPVAIYRLAVPIE